MDGICEDCGGRGFILLAPNETYAHGVAIEGCKKCNELSGEDLQKWAYFAISGALDSEVDQQSVLLVGDLNKGFKAYGPFPSVESISDELDIKEEIECSERVVFEMALIKPRDYSPQSE